ncbi:hypothetical protein [Streptomyces acidicola]
MRVVTDLAAALSGSGSCGGSNGRRRTARAALWPGAPTDGFAARRAARPA